MTTSQQVRQQTFYNTYKFSANAKDPIIDRVHTLVDMSGMKLGDIVKDSGVSITTLRNWFDGPTRRPQFATVAAVGRALGRDLVFAPTKNKANGKAWQADNVENFATIAKRFGRGART